MKKTYTLKINCKGKRTVGKTNKGINVKKQVHDIKIIRNRKEKNGRRKEKGEKIQKKENFTELQKLSVEAEVYSNNKKCD